LFTVYHSNQIDILKSLLVELIRVNPLENPFEKEQILVQSPGMSQWLKMELAQELGVAANIEFPLPATFIWNMFVQILDDVPQRSAFNKEAMTWKLMQILPDQLDKAEFLPLANYLADDADQSKLYQLSEKIADIFDGYLVYRPEWIASWEADVAVTEIGNEQEWQPLLWQALYDHTLAQNQSPFHRANLYQEFIERLESSSVSIENVPKRLFVFGISSLPPRYMDALKALGEHIDVHLMFTNPCRYYWGEVRDRKYLSKLSAQKRKHIEWNNDHSEQKGVTEQLKGNIEQNLADSLHMDVVGNSLLASMGKQGRDNMYLLSQLSSNEIEAFSDVNRDSLLHQVQADILNLEERQDDKNLDSSEHKLPISKQDNSLVIQACHSPMREVEVLHDKLLAMFDADTDLKPRDIIVMVADINAYSPAIQAVFGNAPAERFIPFSISDRTASEESPILAAFIDLVNLPTCRCRASELLELLETPEILARFELSESEFEKAKLWIEEVGIRWGIDADTAPEFELPASEQNTWLFGIRRMLLGYAMHESAGLFYSSEQVISPYNEVQGIDAELAGKIAHFIDKVAFYRSELASADSVSQWQEKLYRLIDDFFLVELEGEVALKSIRDSLVHLTEQLTDASYHEPIAPGVLIEYLKNKLSDSRVSQRFLAGQVNFCTLMPMRSIPFNVVCLLGMNDGVYPRSMPPEAFDLINGRGRPGDRSRRDDDRYLFLEALLSAQNNLYISYIARSIQDNSERVPSILVSELLEYCGQNYCLEGEQHQTSDDSATGLVNHLITHHAMVPYSESAFIGDNSSYAKEWIPVVNKQGVQAGNFIQPLDDFISTQDRPLTLSLAELQRFWRLPVQYFFNRRLKVYFDDGDARIEDDEPFVLNQLQSYMIRDELLTQMLMARLTHQDEELIVEKYLQSQRAQGVLPVGALGNIDFALNKEQNRALVDELAHICQSPLEDLEVNLDIDMLGETQPLLLTGWLRNQFSSGMVRYRSGKIRSQDWLSAWIDHLCAALSGGQKETHIVGYDKKNGVQHKVLQPVEKEQAYKWLSELIELYYQGHNQPYPYLPRTALAGVEQLLKGKEDMQSKMSDCFNDGYLFSGEGSNSYIARVWPEWTENLQKQVWISAQSVLLNVISNSRDAGEE